MAYSEKVIDHYNNPRNVGSFSPSDKDVGTGLVGAPECGDVMKLQLKISDSGVIEDAKFKTFGCGSAIASSRIAGCARDTRADSRTKGPQNLISVHLLILTLLAASLLDQARRDRG